MGGLERRARWPRRSKPNKGSRAVERREQQNWAEDIKECSIEVFGYLDMYIYDLRKLLWRMSLSSCALTNTRARLRPTVTRVTRPDGKILLERDGESEETSQSAPGFVVDTKPDLSVSQVSHSPGLIRAPNIEVILCQILPWLYLSSQDVAGDLQILRL